jgi:DNA-binding MarR family transcriptional regulator
MKGRNDMQNLSKYRLAGTMDATPSGKLLFMILMDLIDMDNAVKIPQRRIAETLGLSKGTVSRNLHKLQDAGYIGIGSQYHSDGGRAANKYYIK